MELEDLRPQLSIIDSRIMDYVGNDFVFYSIALPTLP